MDKRIQDALNSEHLIAENERLYYELKRNPTPEILKDAEEAIRYSEFKEIFTSSFLTFADKGMSAWSAVTGVSCKGLHSQISSRLRNDEDLLLQFYEFADYMSALPLLGFTIDSVRMFMVNYFIYKQSKE